MKVAIVGMGLIGGSIALDLKRTGFASEIIGVDSNAENERVAKELGLAGRMLPLAAAVSQADLTILAVPVQSICALLPSVLDGLSETGTVTDVGSTKERIVRTVVSHPRRAQFVASHPMAGTENSGPAAAHLGLFRGKAAVICDGEKSAPSHLRRVENLYHALEMRLIQMASAEHDIHAAFVSHLSHISSFVLANTVLDIEKNVASIFDLAGGGFESTVRLAKSSPEMWMPILMQNQTHVKYALQAYIKHLEEFHTALSESRWDDLQAQLKQANQIRRVLHDLGNRTQVKK
jgi:prephenate dehydrogenase